ncbi:HAD hydrolase-like protein [bacterium]|nr:HAD hydrolase-like protein [bacterium]
MAIRLPNSIKFVLTDFDGILTDNCVYIDSKGSMTRKINFKDVMAVSLLTKNGYKVGIISGEENAAIQIFKDKFSLDEVHQNIRIKIDVIKSIIDKYNLNEDEYVYVGDDINDFESLCFVKHKITVPDAISKIKNIDGIQITDAHGGNGAFREIADAILNG